MSRPVSSLVGDKVYPDPYFWRDLDDLLCSPTALRLPHLRMGGIHGIRNHQRHVRGSICSKKAVGGRRLIRPASDRRRETSPRWIPNLRRKRIPPLESCIVELPVSDDPQCQQRVIRFRRVKLGTQR